MPVPPLECLFAKILGQPRNIRKKYVLVIVVYKILLQLQRQFFAGGHCGGKADACPVRRQVCKAETTAAIA